MAPAQLSIVVPVYNGAATLDELVERLVKVGAEQRIPLEILLVNDGSRDDSWPAICRLAAGDARVRGVNLMRNYGQHNALLCGIRAARGETIATLDDDLQHPPEQLPRLLAALTPDVDVVYGTPEREQHGVWRNVAGRATKQVLLRTLGMETARQVSAFRAFRGGLRQVFEDYANPEVSVDVLLHWATSRFAAVRVPHAPRRAGTSNYTLGLLSRHTWTTVCGHSVAPLKLASYAGALVLAGGIVGLIDCVAARFAGTPLTGLRMLAVLLALFAGAQLLATGILGEYLARTFLSFQGRPVYLVRETTPVLTEPR